MTKSKKNKKQIQRQQNKQKQIVSTEPSECLWSFIIFYCLTLGGSCPCTQDWADGLWSSQFISEMSKKNEEGDAAFCLISLVIITLKLLRYGLFFGRQFLGGITLHLRKLRKHILVSVRSLKLPLCSQFLIPLKNNTQNIGYFATDKDVVHIKSYSTTPNIMGFCKFERDEDSRYFKNFRS